MSQTRTIGGHAWAVESFTGRESLALFRTLTALAAQPVAEAIREAGQAVGAEDELDASSILSIAGGAIGLAGKIAAKLSDAELDKLAERLLSQTLCDGQSGAKHMDSVFKGDVLSLLEVLAFVVEVNFVGPFVKSLGPAVSSAIELLVSRASPSSPKTSSATRPTT